MPTVAVALTVPLLVLMGRCTYAITVDLNGVNRGRSSDLAKNLQKITWADRFSQLIWRLEALKRFTRNAMVSRLKGQTTSSLTDRVVFTSPI